MDSWRLLPYPPPQFGQGIKTTTKTENWLFKKKIAITDKYDKKYTIAYKFGLILLHIQPSLSI